MWRSPVAHTSGGRGVAGSNPVIPTTTKINPLIVSGLSKGFSFGGRFGGQFLNYFRTIIFP